MKKLILLFIPFLFVLAEPTTISLAFAGQTSASTNDQTPPVQVTVRGIVEKIEMIPGQGPATIWIKNKAGETKQVMLGSMRYLVQKGFNLAVKDEVETRGIETLRGGIYILLAAQIQNISQKQTLLLRDENFRPLWRGGQFGRQQRSPE